MPPVPRRRHESSPMLPATAARARGVVADSWARSIQAGVRPDSEPPFAFRSGELTSFRDEHPLSAVFPLLYEILGRLAEASDCVMSIGDGDGRLLWVCGAPKSLRKAESIRLAEGAWWAERHVGTNAMGTSLRVSDAVQIRSAEHFASAVQRWYCAAAPIHDPGTGQVVGVVNVTGGADIGLPQTLAMIRATAAMSEAELDRLRVLRQLDGRTHTPVQISALGRPTAEVRVGDRTIRLSPRHSDIVVVLAEHPEGLDADALSDALYDEDDHRSALRGEIARLRAVLGTDLIGSRPYRLTTDFAADWLDTAWDLQSRRLSSALRRYTGPLLPRSEAPAVVALRHRLEHRLRTAVLTCQDTDTVVSWTRSAEGAHDLEAWEHQLALLGPQSPLWVATQSEVDRLRAEFGIAR